MCAPVLRRTKSVDARCANEVSAPVVSDSEGIASLGASEVSTGGLMA